MRSHGPDNGHAQEDGRTGEVVRVTTPRAGRNPSDVVFDFSDLEKMRVQDLSVLLTARQLASRGDRTVWAAGVPMHTWRTLYAMGLGGFFKPFPRPDVEAA